MENNIKKAVTAESAPVDNTPQNEAVLEGTSAPTLQEAKAPSTSPTPEVPKTEAAAPTASMPIPEIKQQEVPAQLQETKKQQEKQLSFGNLFKPFSLGATLRQDPSGKNVVDGIKAPKDDYVKNSANKKNIKMTAEDFAKPKK